MDTSSPLAGAGEVSEDKLTQEPVQREILEQLDRITGSSHFRNSKRYPSLLRYIVGEALAGRSESLKERTLGTCVFGRTADYDTNLDPVVRISAGEVRKRIAQYYQSPGHEHELRIEIPLGSYMPRFYRLLESGWKDVPDGEQRFPPAGDHEDIQDTMGPLAPPAPFASETSQAVLEETLSPTTRPSRVRLHLALVYSSLLIMLFAWGISIWRASLNSQLTPGVALFWEKMLHSPEPTLIVLGVHSFDAQGNDISPLSHASMPQTEQTLLSAMTRSDMVQLSDLTSYGEIVRLLTGHTHSFRTQGAADTTLEQLRQGPFVLIGGFNNLWTKRLSQELRFRFVTLNGHDNVIQDSQHPATIWTLDVTQSALTNSRDYGLVSCFFDPKTEQYVILAAGIGKSGTEAAADFLTNERGLDAWFRDVHPKPGSNLQVVVSTDVIEGNHGPPHVVASHIW
jgi:hypothetical protein